MQATRSEEHHYGNMGCRVFKGGIRNKKSFWPKIIIPKGYNCIFRIFRIVPSHQKLGIILKIKVFKIIPITYHKKCTPKYQKGSNNFDREK